MASRIRITALIFAGVLMILIVVAFGFGCDTYEIKLANGLGEVLTHFETDWKRVDLPLGANEQTIAKAEGILNYDEYFFAEYSKGVTRLQVFILYWKPGSINERLVTGHTPDSCWISNGWTCEDRMRNRLYSFPENRKLKRWEYGEYAKDGEHLEVLFTHLAAGDYSVYPVLNDKPLSVWLPIAFQRGLCARPEQLFIRISWLKGSVDVERNEVIEKLISAIEVTFMRSD